MAEREWMVKIECTHSTHEPKHFYAPVWGTQAALVKFLQNSYVFLSRWLQVHGLGDWDPDDVPEVVYYSASKSVCQRCQICLFGGNPGKVLGLPHPDSYSSKGRDVECFFAINHSKHA